MFKFPDEKHSSASADFEYGLTDRWEFDADVPYEFANPHHERATNGIGDIEIGTRYGILKFSDGAFALNAGVGVGIPTGDRLHELGEGRVTVEPSFTVSRWFGVLNAQLNCGWQRAVSSSGDEPRNEFEYNLALLYPVRRCTFALEGNGESNHRETKYYVTPEMV